MKFIVGQYLVSNLVLAGVQKKNIFCLDLEKWYQIGLKQFRLDYLKHDVPNCSVKIIMPNKEKYIYIVDTSSVDHIEARDYDYALIEANYLTDEELDKQIKKAEEEDRFTYLKRVKKTHLSQLQAINWLDKNNIKNYRFIHVHIEKESVKDD